MNKLLELFLGVTILTVCACSKKVDIAEQNKAVVLRAWEEVMNQGNLAAAEEIFAADYVYHTAGSPDLHGLEEGVKKPVSMFRTAFPNIHFIVEDMIAEGDKVAHRWTATGTHKGEFMGIAPTDKQVTMTGIVISHMADGKVVEDWSESDKLGMLQQLGVVPAMERVDFTWGQSMESVTAASVDTQANKAIYLREVEELWNQKNVDVADEIFATNLVNHDPAWPKVTGLESYKQWAAGWIASTPDMQIIIEDLIAEGDKVAGRWTSRWTDTAGAPGLPPTGKQITVTGIDICRIADGRIVERWWSKDILGGMQQLGVIPPLEQAGESSL
ncbi:MAG: ester cyclase [Candidatus Heimdallarchaeota archaeon]